MTKLLFWRSWLILSRMCFRFASSWSYGVFSLILRYAECHNTLYNILGSKEKSCRVCLSRRPYGHWATKLGCIWKTWKLIQNIHNARPQLKSSSQYLFLTGHSTLLRRWINVIWRWFNVATMSCRLPSGLTLDQCGSNTGIVQNWWCWPKNWDRIGSTWRATW